MVTLAEVVPNDKVVLDGIVNFPFVKVNVPEIVVLPEIETPLALFTVSLGMEAPFGNVWEDKPAYTIVDPASNEPKVGFEVATMVKVALLATSIVPVIALPFEMVKLVALVPLPTIILLHIMKAI